LEETVKAINRKREELLSSLDAEYRLVRGYLEEGSAPVKFNKRGQRATSRTLVDFSVIVDEIQDLNRIQKAIKRR
jgi:hypothetical protein